MDKKTLQDGALGYAFAMIIIAFLIQQGAMSETQSLWALVPASAVMIFQALRYRSAQRHAA